MPAIEMFDIENIRKLSERLNLDIEIKPISDVTVWINEEIAQLSRLRALISMTYSEDVSQSMFIRPFLCRMIELAGKKAMECSVDKEEKVETL